MLGAFFVAILFIAWQHSNQKTRTDFEGTVVDRWADYSETQQGSRPRFRLVVESENHERFTLRVELGTYESAKVGMRIRSKSGQIELIDSGKQNVGNK